jgi:hypothetical protein
MPRGRSVGTDHCARPRACDAAAWPRSPPLPGMVWVPGGSFGMRHPQGPGTSVKRRAEHPVVGLHVGRFAPPLLAATAVGAAVGGVTAKFAKHRLERGIGEKTDAALSTGLGRRDRRLRLRRRRHRRRGARQCGQEVRGAHRRRQRKGAEGRTGGSSGRDGRLNTTQGGTDGGARVDPGAGAFPGPAPVT